VRLLFVDVTRDEEGRSLLVGDGGTPPEGGGNFLDYVVLMFVIVLGVSAEPVVTAVDRSSQIKRCSRLVHGCRRDG
jgi:hypothetical protein